MTENEALQWLAYATRQPVDQVLAWELAPWQIEAVGAALAQNPLINPPSRCPAARRGAGAQSERARFSSGA